MPHAAYRHPADEFHYHVPVTSVVAGTPTFVTPSVIGIPANDVPANTVGAFRVTGVFSFVKLNAGESISVDSGLQYIPGLGVTVGGEPYKVVKASPAGEPMVLARINPPGSGGGGGGGSTDISITPTPTGVSINSSTGADGVLPFATATNAGALPPDDKAKLDRITAVNPADLDSSTLLLQLLNADHHVPATAGSDGIAIDASQVVSLVISPDAGNALTERPNGLFATDTGGGGGGATDIVVVPGTASVAINSSTGLDGTLPLADNTNAGAMPPAHFARVAYLTVTASTNLDTMRTNSHVKAVQSHPSITVDPTTQVVTFVPSTTPLNALMLDGTGALVKGYLEVTTRAARPAATANARVKVLQNGIIYVGSGTTWVPESLTVVCTAAQFLTFNSTDFEDGQTFFIRDTNGEMTCLSWTAANGLMEQFGINSQSAALRVPPITLDQDNIDNRWAQILNPFQAENVQLFHNEFLITPSKATFVPNTGILDWTPTGAGLWGVAQVGDLISGIYWAPQG